MSIEERINYIEESNDTTVAVGHEDKRFMSKVGKALQQNKLLSKTSALVLTAALSLGSVSNDANADVGYDEDISKLAYHLERKGKNSFKIDSNSDAYTVVSNLQNKMESARGLDIEQFAEALVNQIEKNEGDIVIPDNHVLAEKSDLEKEKFDAFENFSSAPLGQVSENVRKLAFNLEQREKTSLDLNSVDDAYEVVKDFKSKMPKAKNISVDKLADIIVPQWEAENGEIELPNYLTYSEQSPEFSSSMDPEMKKRMNKSREDLAKEIKGLNHVCGEQGGKVYKTTENGVTKRSYSCNNKI